MTSFIFVGVLKGKTGNISNGKHIVLFINVRVRENENSHQQTTKKGMVYFDSTLTSTSGWRL